MINLPMSQETHGSFVVKGSTLIFIPVEGKPVDIATYSSQGEAIRYANITTIILLALAAGLPS